MKRILLLIFLPSLALSQAAFLQDGEYSIGLAVGKTSDKNQSVRAVAPTISLFGRLDLSIALGTLTRSSVPQLKEFNAFSASIAYYLIRVNQTRLFGAIQYAHTKAKSKILYEDYAQYGGSPVVLSRKVSVTTNSFGIVLGFTPQAERRLDLLPSISVMRSYIANSGKNSDATTIFGADLSLVVPVSQTITFVPFVGTATAEGTTMFEYGAQCIITIES